MPGPDVFDGLAMASGGLCLFMAWAYYQAAQRTAQAGNMLLSVAMLFAGMTWMFSATIGSFVYRGDVLRHLLVLLPAVVATSCVTVGFLQYVSTRPIRWQRNLAICVSLMLAGQVLRMAGGPQWSVDAVVSLMMTTLGVYCFLRHMIQPKTGYLVIGGAFFIQPLTFVLAMVSDADIDHMRQLLGIPFALIGVMVFLIGFFRSHDVMALQLEEISSKRQLLHSMVYLDEVTGLPSAHAQRKRMLGLIAQGSPFGLMLLNLDDFRMVNNNLGPAGGNAIIAQAASEIQSVVDSEGVLARSSGAEFSLVVPGTQDPDALQALAQRILQHLESPIHFENAIVVLPLSVGITRYPADATDLDELQRVAHVAVHQAKTHGGKSVCIYSPEMDAGLQEHLWLDRQLREALDLDQFSLHYQPKLLLESGRATSVEALLRWTHPVRGAIRPDRFIARAEATGLIIPIGRWVLRCAARQAADWTAQGQPIRVAVNVSARQLVDPELMTHLREAQTLSGGLLDIELTESSMLDNERESMLFIDECRRMGYGVHLDDFGTGYSSLSRLATLPLTLIKLDRAFIAPLGKNQKADALLKAMLSIGRELNIPVVAEGVETPEQAEHLRKMGVDYAQGWLYARAMDSNACGQWLMQNATPSTGSKEHIWES